MITRTLTIIISVPVIMACVYIGGIPFFLMLLGIAMVAVNEFYNLMMKKGFQPAYVIGNIITMLFIVFAYYAIRKNWEPAHSAILTLASIGAMVAGVFLKREKDTIIDIAVTIMGMIYVGWFFSYLIFIRSMTEHGGYLFFLMFTIWAMDISAFLAGKFFGKTLLVPSISPKKTWEGAIAGFIVCMIAAWIFKEVASFELWQALILGGMIGIAGQFSDLIESLIKRDAGVKDSSNLVPGHGGVLDRIDSFVITAPLMYYFLVLFVLK